ncbi:hypothetical protein BOVATA_044710 [Babesia ovata]|uniref:Uncharacterized protein n=1 Tax=Babesia ovata TaxID=189622 RepID=A0A2H6KJ17_9APIC|nr:uncharacterized protein BOVATA_044710 [Babesia ovata]GBE62978.1 hypothetical protein BOVATA_044710 [Babesia ovata]
MVVDVVAERLKEGRSLVPGADVSACEMHEVRVLAAAVFRGVGAVGGGECCGQFKGSVIQAKGEISGGCLERRLEAVLSRNIAVVPVVDE